MLCVVWARCRHISNIKSELDDKLQRAGYGESVSVEVLQTRLEHFNRYFLPVITQGTVLAVKDIDLAFKCHERLATAYKAVHREAYEQMVLEKVCMTTTCSTGRGHRYLLFELRVRV